MGKVEQMTESYYFIMTHKCWRCGEEWWDEHDCACDDDCPKCDATNSPISFEAVTVGG